MDLPHSVPLTAITPEDGYHYFFGYYDLQPFAKENKRLTGFPSLTVSLQNTIPLNWAVSPWRIRPSTKLPTAEPGIFSRALCCSGTITAASSTQSQQSKRIPRIYSGPDTVTDVRCDLHNRFSPDGTLVSFDSWHRGKRETMLFPFDKEALMKDTEVLQ